MQPNWPSEEDVDFSPDFTDGDDSLDLQDPPERDLEGLREEVEDLVDE